MRQRRISNKCDQAPADQFYWPDYLGDGELASCSLAAQGLWARMLGWMWLSKVRGCLLIGCKRPDDDNIKKLFTPDIEEYHRLINELLQKGVASQMPNGTIYNRRMYGEYLQKKAISKVKAKAGKIGMQKRWRKQNDNRHITDADNKRITENNRGDNKRITENTNEKDNRGITEGITKITASSSSSSSFKDLKERGEEKEKIYALFFNLFVGSPDKSEKRKPVVLDEIQSLLIDGYSEKTISNAISHYAKQGNTALWFGDLARRIRKNCKTEHQLQKELDAKKRQEEFQHEQEQATKRFVDEKLAHLKPEKRTEYQAKCRTVWNSKLPAIKRFDMIAELNKQYDVGQNGKSEKELQSPEEKSIG